MKILTWNINGIRSVKRELDTIFLSSTYDIICVQETKVTRDQLEEPTAIVEGYTSYFSFSKGRSGYSGVATFVKSACTPLKAEEGISGLLASHDTDGIGCHGDKSGFSDEEIRSLDNEGRTVITQHKIIDAEGFEGLLTIVNVYCPRADPENEDRKIFKIRFYELLQIRVEAILNSGSHVIVLGDVNSSHKKLDHCDPYDDEEFYAHPGRKWLSQFLWDPDRDGELAQVSLTDKSASTGGRFVDTFRIYHKTRENAFTCWHTLTGSRATNYGTRIDYILGDIDLVRRGLTDCDIMPDMMGSDHCPVQASFDWEVLSSKKCPSLCTKFFPEFAGKQQKLSSFFVKKDCSDEYKLSHSKSQKLQSSQESSDSGSSIQTAHRLTQPDSSTARLGQTQSITKDSDPKKRQGTELKQSKLKRLKVDSKPIQGKQGNLLSFFGKKLPSESKEIKERGNNKSWPNKSGSTSESTSESLKEKEDLNHLNTVVENNESGLGMMENETTVTKSSHNLHVKGVNASASWKNLLKGPPPAPLCKGHQEPCLLRTVKKDSLNKGRQFWVCNRPEGHKSNPEARCDYFVWVDKKKKSLQCA